MRAPIQGRITLSQLFGGDQYHESRSVPYGDTTVRVIGHTGIDIVTPVGTPVYAVWPGVVSHGYEAGGFGNYLILTVADGRTALYGHLSGYSTPEGAHVAAGAQIALSGNTGSSTGAHVHLEVRPAKQDFLNGYRSCIDPLPGFDHDVIPMLDVSNV